MIMMMMMMMMIMIMENYRKNFLPNFIGLYLLTALLDKIDNIDISAVIPLLKDWKSVEKMFAYVNFWCATDSFWSTPPHNFYIVKTKSLLPFHTNLNSI